MPAEQQIVHDAFVRARAQHPAMADDGVLVMALMASLNSLNTRDRSTSVIGEYRPQEHPTIATLVNVVMARNDGDVDAARTRAVGYILLAHHLVDAMIVQKASERRMRSVTPKWSTVLSLILGDEERLDVVDHLSDDGEVPYGLVTSLYI